MLRTGSAGFSQSPRGARGVRHPPWKAADIAMPILDLITRFMPTSLSWPIIILSALFVVTTLGGLTGAIVAWLQTTCLRS
jgi:hypothetical protein